MSFQRAEDSKQPDVKLQNGGEIFWILLFYKKLNPTQKWPFLSKTTQPLSSRVGEPFSWKAICLVAPGWSGLSGGEVTGHMLRLVLAGGLSADPSDHYLGQVLNLLEIIWQNSTYLPLALLFQERHAAAGFETQFMIYGRAQARLYNPGWRIVHTACFHAQSLCNGDVTWN